MRINLTMFTMISLTTIWKIDYKGVRDASGLNQCVAVKMVGRGSGLRATLKDLLMNIYREGGKP